MEDKIFKILVTFTVLLGLATVAVFAIHAPSSVSLLLALVVALAVTVRMHARFSKEVMDFKYSVDAPPKNQIKPGDSVKYTVEFTAKAAFELTRLSATITAKFLGENGVSFVEHKEQKIHIENKQYLIGGAEQIQGAFILPDNPRLYAPKHSWELVLLCEIKSALDKKAVIELKSTSLAAVAWDSI